MSASPQLTHGYHAPLLYPPFGRKTEGGGTTRDGMICFGGGHIAYINVTYIYRIRDENVIRDVRSQRSL